MKTFIASDVRIYGMDFDDFILLGDDYPKGEYVSHDNMRYFRVHDSHMMLSLNWHLADEFVDKFDEFERNKTDED